MLREHVKIKVFRKKKKIGGASPTINCKFFSFFLLQIIVASGRGEVQAVRRNVDEIAEMDNRGGGTVGQSGEREGGYRGASKSNNRYERKQNP